MIYTICRKQITNLTQIPKGTPNCNTQSYNLAHTYQIKKNENTISSEGKAKINHYSNKVLINELDPERLTKNAHNITPNQIINLHNLIGSSAKKRMNFPKTIKHQMYE